MCACVCIKSIKTGALFTKTEMKNIQNKHFLQKSSWHSTFTPGNFLLVEAPLKLCSFDII